MVYNAWTFVSYVVAACYKNFKYTLVRLIIMWEKILNSLLILTISAVLLGSMTLQFFYDQEPCPLCFLQRLCMLSVASAALFNICFSVRKLHYGLILFGALCGGFVATRHIALNICKADPFGEPFWGISLYTWAFFIFVCTILAVALFLMVFDQKPGPESRAFKNWKWAPVSVLFIVALLNIFAAWRTCGFGLC